MRTNKQILNFVVERIRNIYLRPLMYGGSPSGVELILHCYHEMWSEILKCKDEYDRCRIKIHRSEGCGSSNFSNRFMELDPDAKEDEIIKYVVTQWKKISDLLGIPVKYGIEK